MLRTIIDVSKEPYDEFGRYLAQLRKRKGVSARSLSIALGLNEAYVHAWENRPVRISKDVLERVCMELEVDEYDREQLYRLADKRDAPESAKGLYKGSSSDPDANLLRVLLTVDHDWPSQPTNPNPHSERAQLFLDAIAWLLCKAVGTKGKGLLDPLTDIRWPEPLVRCNVVPPVKEEMDPIDVPETMVGEEMPFVDQLQPPVTQMDAATQSLGMARIYRRLLFSDPRRAQTAASLLAHWSYDRTQELYEAISLRFKETDTHETYAITDVGCRAVASVGERSLAGWLWCYANTTGEENMYKLWHCVLEPADWRTLSMPAWITRNRVKTYQAAQELRDSLFRMRSYTWPYVLQQVCDQHGARYGSETELERQLRSRCLKDDMATRISREPWHIAAIDPDVIIWYLRTYEAMVPPPAIDSAPKEQSPSPKRATPKRRKQAKRKRR